MKRSIDNILSCFSNYLIFFNDFSTIKIEKKISYFFSCNFKLKLKNIPEKNNIFFVRFLTIDMFVYLLLICLSVCKIGIKLA